MSSEANKSPSLPVFVDVDVLSSSLSSHESLV